jgi:L-lactate utilization protein LutB
MKIKQQKITVTRRNIMDGNKKLIFTKKIERTLENLEKNNMQAFYVESKTQIVDLVQELLQDGDTVSCGGSMTLFETGVIDHLRSNRYKFLDRYKPGLTRAQINDIFIASFSADAYVCSSNAITENGELYNVDGNSNRVAAMIYGPQNVIVVAGYNKIVRNVEEAAERVRSIAAPANAARLNSKTPCVQTGYCGNCKSEDRICCNTVVMGPQRQKGRIKVIIVGEELGY